MRRDATNRLLLFSPLMFVAVTGCALGPAAIESGRLPYNQVVQQTNSEQLLLNLVRLVYRENPLFLDVGSISAQYVVTQAAQIGGTLNENVPMQPINPDVLNIEGRLSLEERPTITYSPLQGAEFAARMLSPLKLETIELLIRSGWRADRVLRLTVQAANGLDNASAASGPTPAEPPDYERFARAAELFRVLQQRGQLHVAFEARPVRVGPPVSAISITPATTMEALRSGMSFLPVESGPDLVALHRSEPALIWRIPGAARDSAEFRELAQLLRLEPGRDEYAVQMSTSAQMSEPGPSGRFDRLTLMPRSLLGSLFYLSQGVQSPEPHRTEGRVTVTRSPDGAPFDWQEVVGGVLNVHSQTRRPHRAAVAVQYRDWWFYIDDTDLTSKSTFALLGQVFALQAGTAEGSGPVLTLGLGG